MDAAKYRAILDENLLRLKDSSDPVEMVKCPSNEIVILSIWVELKYKDLHESTSM